jgi:hypothetical protein
MLKCVCSVSKITRPEIKLRYDEYKYYICDIALISNGYPASIISRLNTQIYNRLQQPNKKYWTTKQEMVHLYFYSPIIRKVTDTHVLNNLHNYGPIETAMEPVHKAYKCKRMNTHENYYIQYFQFHNIIQEQTITKLNSLFQTAYNMRSCDHNSDPSTDSSAFT